tara:strand:+ start:933 stop:1748 length:816 start_codon:yes stop_codon:yes gene_type:complete
MKNYITLSIIFFCLQLFSQQTIETKFAIPDGYEREIISEFHQWIINQPLKEDNKVLYYDGIEKHNLKYGYPIWAAVFDYDLGTHKYHQCADASMYLYARYNWESKNFSKLAYHSCSGDLINYQDYLKGASYNLINNGQNLNTEIYPQNSRTDNINTFKDWMIIVWTWANTWSLINRNDVESVNIMNLKPGDVFIQAGDRCDMIGHAITVVDIIKNNKGDKKYILAQSYMPGQENQILLNQETGDVWYNLNYDEIITPEWSFNSTDLKRFKK